MWSNLKTAINSIFNAFEIHLNAESDMKVIILQLVTYNLEVLT